jgi:EAL domain-containing protein (putative c-di-GMP-specific phosphodiesterase class I)
MLKESLSDCRIISYFQPIINNKTLEIEKYESLVRMVNKDGEILPPSIFLEISKRGRYYAQITNEVLKNSFNALNQTTKEISINLSALDIEMKATRKKIFEFLEKHKQKSHRVTIELLEDENIENFNTI